jgi:hypothetical protein
MALLHACGHVLKIYAEYHRGRTRGDANAVEEAYADVLCVLKLLYHLVMKVRYMKYNIYDNTA